ncbi:MAG: cell division protein FtsL [Acidaminococcaceae bacterium]
MLARKYEAYAWEESLEAPQTQVRSDRKATAHKLLRRRLLVLCACVLVFYFISVVRSAAYVRISDSLVALKQQEASLLSQNAELKIEVERLKSPSRIASIAQGQLGMEVARNNIYVQAENTNNASGGYAYAR